MTLDTPVAFSVLPAAIRRLVLDLREERSGKTFRPRYVYLELREGPNASVDLGSFGIRAAAGELLHRETQSSYLGDDGEPYYTSVATYRGPVVKAFGHGRHVRVTLVLPTNLVGDEFYGAVNRLRYRLSSGLYSDLNLRDLLAVLADAAFAGAALPLPTSEASP